MCSDVEFELMKRLGEMCKIKGGCGGGGKVLNVISKF